MVASGEIDGAAIDSHVLGVALRNAPQLDDLIRVVETLGPSPSQPVVVKSDLDSALKEQIRSRLLELRDPLMTEFLVEGFAPAPDYSEIAAVVGASSR
jgi:phosphonate transport system substrate-binding protein